MRDSRWYSELLVAVVVLTVVGCGGGSAAGDTSVAGAPESTTEQPTATVAADTGEPKSLDDYLGLAANALRGQGGGQGGAGGGLDASDQEQILEQQRLIQQQIQVCMQGQGFTYVPEAVGDDLRFFGQTQVQSGSAADYAAAEGFGISTRFDEILDGDVDLTDEADEDNPNDVYLAGLSEGEADAWQLALQGQPPERNDAGQLIDAETGEVVQGAGGRGLVGGCTQTAQLEVRGDFSSLAELSDEFAELEERIESDPRIAEIRRNWIDCMTGEGFDYTDEAEARADINSQMRPLLQSFFGQAGQDGQDAAGPGQGARGGGGGNVLAAIAGLQLTTEQEAELEALQDLERSIAVASLGCQADTTDEIAEINQRYEDEFVAANLTTLEALGQ